MRRAFTLVELLVVISIIVLLVSILVPALGQAFYIADLANCSGNQHAITQGVIAYSQSSDRYYPNRPGNLENPDLNSYEPYLLANKSHDNQPGNVRDVRPLIADFIVPELLSCPLAEGTDLSIQATEPSEKVYGGFNFFFGWRYRDEAPMRRFGDSFTATTPATIPNYTPYRADESNEFPVLVSDIDFVKPVNTTTTPLTGDTYSHGSHPDSRRRMVLESYQNATVTGDELNITLPVAVPTVTTRAWYRNTIQGRIRGTIDTNVGFADGSVQRFDDIKHNDERMLPIPLQDSKFGYENNGSLQEFLQLPNR